MWLKTVAIFTRWGIYLLVDKTETISKSSVIDVAARAGVSIATVSRVLNNHRNVSPHIVEQVRRAVTELNYVPQRVHKRSVPRERNERKLTEGTIAIVCLGQSSAQWLTIPIIGAAVAAVSKVAEAQGLAVTITDAFDANALGPTLRRRDLRGALALVPRSPNPKLIRALAQELPTVRMMGGQLAPTEVDHVTVDNGAVGYLAAAHLIARGCKRIAFVSSYPNWQFLKMREQGFGAALAEAGTTDMTPDFRSLPWENVEMASIAAQVDRLIEEKVDGIFCSRDDDTVDVYRLLAARGIRPNEDLAVVSCDNDPVRLQSLTPRPPSIDLNLQEIARHAVRRLAWRIENRDEAPTRILVCPTLADPTPPTPRP